jgi:hypothetical protein
MGMLRNSLQRTFKKYINIQAPEGIGYQSLTRTQGFSKGREEKRKTMRIKHHRPLLSLLLFVALP